MVVGVAKRQMLYIALCIIFTLWNKIICFQFAMTKPALSFAFFVKFLISFVIFIEFSTFFSFYCHSEKFESYEAKGIMLYVQPLQYRL